MQRLIWADIAVQIDNALRLLRDLGLVDLVAASRFAGYRDRLHGLIAALREDGREAAARAFDADRLTNGVAMAECAELAHILPFIEATPRPLIRPKVERMLLGPTIPTDEDENSSIGRNMLFELNLAAQLFAAGLQPELGERPDLACEVDGRRLLIECKRPASIGGARKAIKRARDQIVRDLKRSRAGSRGVIALSLSKIANPGDLLFVYRGEAAGRAGLDKALDSYGVRLLDSCAVLPDKIVGMLWHLVTVGVDENVSLITLAQTLTVEGFNRNGRDDGRELRALYERIDGFGLD